MSPQTLFAITAGLAALSGIFSPYLQLVLLFAPLWAPSWLPAGPGTLLFLASLLTATTVLLVSGVPAALAERLFPASRGGPGPMYVWAVSAAVLSLPSFAQVAVLLGR